jgi:hypothetical protein
LSRALPLFEDPQRCQHEFEFSSSIDEPEMKCDKCGERLEIVSTPEIDGLRKSAYAFAKAWAKWHDHENMEVDQEMIRLAHDIVGAIGLEVVEIRKGKHSLAQILPNLKGKKS